MGIKAKILKELQKKPRRLKELKAKLGNDKKVARAVDELVERNKVVCRKGVYAVPDPKTGSAVECTLVKLAGKFGFARPVQPDGQDIFIPGKYLMAVSYTHLSPGFPQRGKHGRAEKRACHPQKNGLRHPLEAGCRSVHRYQRAQ